MPIKNKAQYHPNRVYFYLLIAFCIGILACNYRPKDGDKKDSPNTESNSSGVSVYVLGTLQDGGSPHAGCKKLCCKLLFNNPDTTRKVVSLGLVDATGKKTWLIEATPYISTQMKMLKRVSGFQEFETPDGIFITHAHIGHYSGLMYLGKEAMGTKGIKVFAMPRLKTFLETNGPWSQLVSQHNITIAALRADSTIKLNNAVTITPFSVPHRDEYSETVGYKIEGPNKTALFIPDINKWDIWKRNIIDEIARVDYAFIDATFYDGDEISSRNIKEIPHPFVIESLELFNDLPAKEKDKIYFIHLNHTNPLLNHKSKQSQSIIRLGFHIARFGDKIAL